MWFSNGSNKSAGVAILKDKFSGQILRFEKDMSGRCNILVVVTNHSYLILINIYATNNKFNNLLLIQDVESRVSHLYPVYPVSKVMWGGDFTTILDEYADRWPPKNITTSCDLQHICLLMGLLDIWRKKNPQQNMYTWSYRNLSIRSHIDLWLISNDLVDLLVDVLIEPAILTDHKLNLNDSHIQKYSIGYWKLNSSLLKNGDLKLEIRDIIDKC